MKSCTILNVRFSHRKVNRVCVCVCTCVHMHEIAVRTVLLLTKSKFQHSIIIPFHSIVKYEVREIGIIAMKQGIDSVEKLQKKRFFSLEKPEWVRRLKNAIPIEYHRIRYTIIESFYIYSPSVWTRFDTVAPILRQCTICFQSLPLFVLNWIGFSSNTFLPLVFILSHAISQTTKKKYRTATMA